MWVVSAGLFIIAFIIQVYILYKAFKTKDNMCWIALFIFIVSSILSCFIIGFYEIVDIDRTDTEGLVIVILCILAGLVYAGVFILSLVLKFIERTLVNKSGKVRETLSKEKKQTAIAIPLLCTVFVACTFCSLDFGRYEIRDYIEEKRYEEVKKKKLVEMVNYLNNKYDTDFTVSDNIYYREENYEDDGGWFYSEYYNIPYIGIFDNGKEKITVADRKGILSDNAQIDEINYLVADYYSDITGVDIEYVHIKDRCSDLEDNHINMLLQNGFNEIITKDNVDLFMKDVFKGECVELLFYVKDSEDREEQLNLLTSNLSFLERENIDNIAIYFYKSDEDLIIEEKKLDLYGDHKYDEIDTEYDDSYDDCKFGYYYVPNSHETYGNVERENTFTLIAYSLKRNSYGYKYNDKNTRLLNEWIVYEF